MDKAYLVCAILGGTLWVCQFVLSLLGGHHDLGASDSGDMHGGGDVHGTDHDTDSHDSAMAWLIGLLTFRSIVAGCTFFGLGGLAATYAGYSAARSFAIAAGSGAVALLIVGLVVRMLRRLDVEGNVHIDGAVGHVGTVYLHIPANNSGAGKVTIKLQNRTVEYRAISNGNELPTGSQIVVIGVVGPDLVEVIPART